MKLYKKIVNPILLIRRINIAVCNLKGDSQVEKEIYYQQFQLFSDEVDKEKERLQEKEEKKVQNTILEIKNKYGKNSILKGLNLLEGGTMIERNKQVGGHQG